MDSAYLAMSPAGFADLFNINEFASSDYVGPQNLTVCWWYDNERVLGPFKIFSTSAVAGGKNFAYHTRAVGIGINSDVQT